VFPSFSEFRRVCLKLGFLQKIHFGVGFNFFKVHCGQLCHDRFSVLF